MFACTKCGRKYASQNSLTRHAHNHRKTKQHTCTRCGVVFYRGDLLSRHIRLHENPQADTGTNSASSPAQIAAVVSTSRRRCHTACLKCRELRTKCNGQRPCSTCLNSGNPCEYSSRSNRVSHIPTTNADYESPSALDLPDRERSDQRPESSEIRQQTIEVFNHQQDANDNMNDLQIDQIISPSSMTFHGAVENNPYQQQLLHSHRTGSVSGHSAQDDAHADLGLAFYPSMVDTVSWPWLHESLYLPSDQNSYLDTIGSSNMMDFTRNTISGMSTRNQIDDNNFHLGDGQGGRGPRQEVLSRDCNFPTEDYNLESLKQPPVVDSLNTGNIHDDIQGTQGNRARTIDNSANAQSQVINDLITYASMTDASAETSSERSNFWRSMSPKVSESFQVTLEEAGPSGLVLVHFFDLYFIHFGPLWPLLSTQSLDSTRLHPLLYLVLTSIGAMYGNSGASNYGAMMHNSIRIYLTVGFELDDTDTDLMWLAQARLLTQVAALYFGQPKAFSYAQHLGALLVAQARRMDLFSAAHAERAIAKFSRLKGSASDNERLAIWLHLEARRRLAFGIFRGDTYTSVLLHTKPLVSLEEIDLEFPLCDAVWRGCKMAARVCLHMIEHDRTPGRNMRASDIYRIALDREEPLPPLDPAGHELLLFGLQSPLWRFSRDQNMFERLTGEGKTFLVQQDGSQSPDSISRSFIPRSPSSGSRPARPVRRTTMPSEANRLDSTSRHMIDLASEFNRFLLALQKWEQALPLVKTFVQTDRDRSTLLSSLILFHLGYLRLYAPIQDLHQIQYRLADNHTVDDDMIRSVSQWAGTDRARLAAERACTIWSLIKEESQRVENKRVRFNLLAFTGLHHGAVLLWSYAGARDLDNDVKAGLSLLTIEMTENHVHHDVLVNEAESGKILASFVRLYDLVSPARWSSFAKAANTLSTQKFPRIGYGTST